MAEGEVADSTLQAVAALERKIDAGFGAMAEAVQAATRGQLDELLERERRNAGFTTRADLVESVGAVASRAARIEDDLRTMRDQMVGKDDVAALAARFDRLATKIDGLAVDVAGRMPRIDVLERAVADMRTIVVPRPEVEGIERHVAELGARVDALDQSQTTRAVGLAGQVNAWAVSLLLVVVGALASYVIMAAEHH